MPPKVLRKALLFGLLTIGCSAHAGILQQKELQDIELIQEKLDTQKQWIKYRYDQALAQCYETFWMQRCQDKARVIYLKDTKELREQEIALNERQRQVNEILKDEKDQQRLAENQDPKNVSERAKNRANYQEKQRLRAEREAELEERRKDAGKRAQENRKTSPLD
jgi:hypothetical protein